MGRTLGTNLSTDTSSALPSPRYLVEIGVGGTVRLATGGNASGADISYNSNTWVARNVTVSELAWEGAIASAFEVSIQLDPNELSTYTAITPETTVKLYQTAALSSYAGSNDVKLLYDGVINGGARLQRGLFTFNVEKTMEWFPPWSVTEKWGFTDLMLPGSYRLTANGEAVIITVELS